MGKMAVMGTFSWFGLAELLNVGICVLLMPTAKQLCAYKRFSKTFKDTFEYLRP